MSSYSFKIVILGDGSVGKTSLINRFVHGKFESNYIATIGTQITKFEYELDSNSISLVFWDLAGQSGFAKLRQNFFGGSDAVIIIVDGTNMGSVGKLNYFLELIQQEEARTDKENSIPIIILLNKADLIKHGCFIGLNSIKHMINAKAEFYETSMVTGEGVDDSIRGLVSYLYEKSQEKA